MRNWGADEGRQPNYLEDGIQIGQTRVIQTKVTHHVAKKTQLATVTSIIDEFSTINFMMHFNAFFRTNQVLPSQQIQLTFQFIDVSPLNYLPSPKSHHMLQLICPLYKIYSSKCYKCGN